MLWVLGTDLADLNDLARLFRIPQPHRDDLARNAHQFPYTMASTPDGGKEFYPGRSFSISQLLYATKRKIQGITSGGRCVRGS